MSQITRRHAVGLLAGAAAFAASGRPSGAADWPTQPINLMVPYPPGGGVDYTARVLAEVVRAGFGQPVVVENRAGAGGSNGVAKIALSDPDGYSLAVVSPGPITTGPNLQKVAYDPLTLTHITRLTTAPILLIARNEFPAKDLKAMIAYAKANPGAVRFANTGPGTVTHLAAELMAIRLGVPMIQVPYRGTAPAVTDVISGVVDVLFTDVSAMQAVESKQVQLLAVTGAAKRWDRAPNVPLVSEEIADFSADSWYSLIGPPNMPAPLRDRIGAEFIKALNQPDVKQKLLNNGLDAAPMPSEPFTAFVKKEFALWHDVITKAKITTAN